MEYFILASGSKGNCTIIRSRHTALMLDCGVSGAYLKRHLQALGISLSDLQAVLFTHHHTDHIKGMKWLQSVPAYAPFPLQGMRGEKTVVPYEAFSVGDFTILPIALSHDAPECVGYIFRQGGESLAAVTDTGYVSDRNLELLQDADYYIFEANHDVEMLMETDRPAMLKARILSDTGHMNNEDAGRVLSCVIGNHTKEIVLAHLSEEANTPEKALGTVREILESDGISLAGVRLRAASQREMVAGGSR